MKNTISKKVLQCDRLGDLKYSALYARLKFLGKEETIEEIYQLSKRFDDNKPPKSTYDAKGRKPTHFNIRGVMLKPDCQYIFYHSLWVLYFICNSDLYKYACEFDEFYDTFKGKSKVCQADSIRRIVKIGLEASIKECSSFLINLFLRYKNKRKTEQRVLTTVVNMKDEIWDTIIDRPTMWGNPFHMKEDTTEERKRVYKLYMSHFWKTDLPEKIYILIGDKLGCWCKPKLCHGMYLAKIANQLCMMSILKPGISNNNIINLLNKRVKLFYLDKKTPVVRLGKIIDLLYLREDNISIKFEYDSLIGYVIINIEDKNILGILEINKNGGITT